jgi:hypothetical protein
MALRTGWLCRPCTTLGYTSQGGLSPGVSSSPAGMLSNQLKCTMRSSIGGCGFRAICLTKRLSLLWAARFCRTIPGTCSRMNTSLTRGRAGVNEQPRAGCASNMPPPACNAWRTVGAAECIEFTVPLCNRYLHCKVHASDHDDTAKHNVASLLKGIFPSHPVRVIPPARWRVTDFIRSWRKTHPLPFAKNFLGGTKKLPKSNDKNRKKSLSPLAIQNPSACQTSAHTKTHAVTTMAPPNTRA